MNNSSQFLSNSNLLTLWEIIRDQETFQFLSRDKQTDIHATFIANIRPFYEKERRQTSNLIDLNKKYLVMISNHIKTTYPHKPTKITIHDALDLSTQPITPITTEEIHNERQTAFINDLNKQQADFDMYINKPVPPTPNFADPIQKEEPIKDMETMLREFQNQRKYEVPNLVPVLAPMPATQAPVTDTTSDDKSSTLTWGENTYHENVDEDTDDQNDDAETTLLFSKLKQKNNTQQKEQVITLELIYTKLLEIEKNLNETN